MRVLITGAGGMLGTDARAFFAAHGHQVIATDQRPLEGSGSAALNIKDYVSVRAVMQAHRPDLVLHCAAMTNVDGCERDPDAAYAANALGSWCVATAAQEVGAALVAISTDFVFDGTKDGPYTEFDAPNPLSHYGASKLAGERMAMQSCARTYVLRTSWLYGTHGRNFPYTIMERAKSQGELFVVADQFGAPTFTRDLLETAYQIIQTPLYGVYHVCNAGRTSWHGFASEILKLAGMPDVPVHALTSEETAAKFGTPTRRPKNSVLRRYALELQHKDVIRPWEDALGEFLAAVNAHDKI
ncbi:MAG: dTDP-4-dehydrorhamnose reductase [Capsulimonas sp.]|jgi:dTDP-4-dehydrorhamnose reductase|nr:dTDP-4-dehydrorhamnose reductase [Capsulimonas sp.]